MRPLLIVELYILINSSAQRFRIYILVQKNVLVFESPEESLNENIVQGSALAIHRDFYGL